MFQTKRSLKNRIQALEEALRDEKELKRMGAFAKGLQPVKNLGCTMCKHCFRYYNGTSVYAFGCLKGIGCEDFELSEPSQNRLPIRCYNTDQAQYGDEGCNGIRD